MSGQAQIESGQDRVNQTLIDQLLAEQRNLTAVAQFSRWHDESSPVPSQRYRELIPVSKPKAGEQLAFEVALDKCSGCKACVTACHNLNQLNENETWRSVGFLHGGTAQESRLTNVTTACHHCIDPACLSGCPVLAYEKDAITGIVQHLGDRCMGCQYCTLKCPYEVPQFRKDRGIVRKCDMCSHRLANEEPPACVQSCPNEAIRIVIVNKEEITASTTSSTELVPGAPKSDYTFPSTRYRTPSDFSSNTLPADFNDLKPQTGHDPLAWMLVLTQLSVGLSASTLLLKETSQTRWAILAFVAAGLVASVFHLGKPFRAWRALVNLRRSWLSREIAAFSLLAGLVSLHALIPSRLLQVVVVLTGFLGVFTSVMIYVDTRRALWNLKNTFTKFLGSTLLLGLAGQLALGNGKEKPLATALLILSALKLAFEAKSFLHLLDPKWSLEKKSALLLSRDLKVATQLRFLSGIMGGILLPGWIAWTGSYSPLEIAAFVLCCLGEFLERHLFFRTAATPKMPGGVTT